MGQDANADDGVRTPPSTSSSVGLTGRRVAWLGPAQAGISPTYWASADASDRLPRLEEKTRVTTGEHGTVGELVTVSEAGHWYVIRFDGGHELETVLPAPDLLELDPAPRTTPQAKALNPRPARYAPAHASGWFPFLRRARQHGL